MNMFNLTTRHLRGDVFGGITPLCQDSCRDLILITKQGTEDFQ
jgi:hypothetical protein